MPNFIGEYLSFEHIKSDSKGNTSNKKARIPLWSASHELSQHDGGNKMVRGHRDAPRVHGLLIRKGNVEGAWEPSVAVPHSGGRMLLKSHQVTELWVNSFPLRLNSRLGPKIEKGRGDLGEELSWQKHLQPGCLNSLVATEINVPLIFCGFLCCESHHFAKVPPFLSLVCPSLD